MKLDQYLNQNKLEQYVDAGLVTVKFHDKFPLMILTYSRQTVYDNVWDEITEKCRGLIVNIDTEEIVARPFDKFFNYGTVDRPETSPENLPPDPPILTEKIDGSLGIGYAYGDEFCIASKGSFHSDHAKWMTKRFRELLGENKPFFPEGCTPVFEMVCEDIQHHVVHYGNERLYLIALIDKETGEELPYHVLYQYALVNSLSIPKVCIMPLKEAVVRDEVNEEGYVATWTRRGRPPLKIKIKFVNFLRLQKMLHHVRPKDILDAMRHDHLRVYMEEWQHNSTPAFAVFVNDWRDKFLAKYLDITEKVSSIWYSTRAYGFRTRKEYAEFFNREENREYAGILFTILDGKDYKPAIWKKVEPLAKVGKPLYEEEE